MPPFLPSPSPIGFGFGLDVARTFTPTPPLRARTPPPQGYSGGALKHGPFALIEGPEGQFGATPIICLVLDDEYAMQMRTVAEEVKARHAEVIIITDNPRLAEGLDPSPIVIPRNGPLTALTAVLPLQLLAYELALLRGVNPDVPRNLAKAVTVD